MPVKLSVGRKGLSSDHYLATLAGLEILKEGGNAFDAAIATSAVLSVVQPHMGGPGGDGFLLAFRGDEVISLMSPGRSPSGFDAERYLEERPFRGSLTITIPGLVRLWGYVNEEYGTMSLERLLRPAISLAYNGFPAGRSLSDASKMVARDLSQYKVNRYYSNIGLGDKVSNKDMARTLRLIASRGWEEFYYGSLAEELVNELQEQGVDLGLDDFMSHEAYEVPPLRLTINDLTLYELPPNTQGASTLQLISALYELGLNKLSFDDPERISAWKEPIEAVYHFRDAYLGDPDHMEIDVSHYLTYEMMSSLIKGAPSDITGHGLGGDTTFFLVTDGETLIGFIQSLFHPFGSGLIMGGFPVNNRAIGFAKRRGIPNSPAPRKLPLHTLSILGVEGEGYKYVIGCVGGDVRPQLHLRAFENIFIYKMDPDQAVSAPRFIYSYPLEEGEVIVEEPLKLKEGLRTRRVPSYSAHGHVHVGVISRKREPLLANDPRSEGVTLSIN